MKTTTNIMSSLKGKTLFRAAVAMLTVLLLFSLGCHNDKGSGPESAVTEEPTPTDCEPSTLPSETAEATSAPAEPTSTPDPLAAIVGKEVVYNDYTLTEVYLAPGEVYTDGWLYYDVDDPAYRDSLFYVWIEFYYVYGKQLKTEYDELHEKIMRLESSEVGIEFMKAYYDWWYNVKFPSLTDEEYELYLTQSGEGVVYHNDLLNKEYYEYLVGTASSEEAERQLDFAERWDSAVENFQDFNSVTSEEVMAGYIAEVDRLIECGYAVDKNTLYVEAPGFGGHVKAYLSADKIKNFEVHPEYAYQITYAGFLDDNGNH